MRTTATALLALPLALVIVTTAARADPAPALFGADDDGSAEPAAVEHKVQAELALAKKGKPRTIMLAVVATDSWGCDCLPFVFAPYAMSAPDGVQAFVFPVTTAGVNPGAVTAGSGVGTYELTGHFTKERITERTWLTRRKLKAGGDRKHKAPVFAVDSWCFRKAEDTTDYAELIAEMQQASVPFCN